MTPNIAKLGHVALVTPDLEESTWFFRDVIGLKETERVDNTVYLRAQRDWEHHTLSLTAGERAELDHIGWQVRDPAHVQAFADRLEDSGTNVEYIDDDEMVGHGDTVRFRTPNGHRFELYYEVDKPVPPSEKRSRLKNRVHSLADATASIPRRVDHVNLHGSNIEEVHNWLQDVLGFQMNEYVLDEEGNVRGGWLSTNSLVHTLAYGGEKGDEDATLHHLSYYLDSLGDLMNAADVVREHGVEIEGGPGKHGITQANFLYIRDPGSGHRIELFNGGYQIFNPDWEPIEWDADEAEVGLTWFGNTPGQESTPSK
ncbi:VOC family protein [Halobellus rufus]|uniref:VOC family protein n=1 Tax=Halobellus rufus TaxID=1448860 RepID=UPI000678D3E1|nr:VOC family protein [Halobellus rufus]